MSASSNQNFIDIVTEFYCSVSGKKDIQRLTSEISDFVMNNASILDKQNMGKLILSYFLKLYTKFNMKTQQEWDHAFELASAQDRAVILIATFPQKQMQKWGFLKLKQRSTVSELYSQTILTQISGNEMTIIDEIQVQDDIKLKTKFFFKWCMYIKNAKNFKNMKMKSIHNMKISHCFNTYGIKFNYFTAWKMLIKKRKLYVEREENISRRAKESLLKGCLRKMSESGKILLIQEQLTSIIRHKIGSLNKNRVFKSLKINFQFMKCTETRSYGQNIYASRFIELCSKGIQVRMNRSYVEHREKFNFQQKNCLMGKIINQLKNRVHLKNQRQRQIQICIKKENLINFIKNSRSNAQLIQNTQNIISYLMFKKKKITLTILHFNMITNRQQKFEEASTLESRLPSLSDRRILQVHRKKQLAGHYKQLTIKLSQNSHKSVFKALLKRRQQNKLSQNNTIRIINLWKSRLFVHDRRNKDLLRDRQRVYKEIAKIRGRGIQRKMMSRWKKIKQANQVEEKSLHFLCKISDINLQRAFLRKMESRATESERFQKSNEILRVVILKVGFEKIGGRTFYINREVQALQKRRAFTQMHNLFQLLSRNSKYNYQLSQALLSYSRTQAQHQLINSLKNLNRLKNKHNSLSQSLSKSNQQKYIKYYLFILKRDKDISEKKNYLSIKIFLNNFRKSIKNQNQIIMEISHKVQALQEKLCINSAVCFISKLKTHSKKRNVQSEKSYNVLKMIVLHRVEKVQMEIKELKSLQQIREKGKKTRNKLLSGAMNRFTYNFKNRKLNEFLSKKRKRQNLNNMKRVYEEEMKEQDQMMKMQILIYKNKSKKLLKNMIAECEEMAHKQMLLNNRIMQYNAHTKRQFLTLLQNNKQTQSASLQLLTSKTHKHLSELLKTFYLRKYGKIKYNCSLKLYASNLLKRSMKGMKRQHEKIRQKENTLKFEKSSLMIAQKSIEKSFKSNSLCEQIEKFNIRKSRQIR